MLVNMNLFHMSGYSELFVNENILIWAHMKTDSFGSQIISYNILHKGCKERELEIDTNPEGAWEPWEHAHLISRALQLAADEIAQSQAAASQKHFEGAQ
ncbi:MAG: hypothetical protein DRQ48_00865 [Gammaproteobacteria bacterium]|nr:MAG: hypothetical protein DRQ44_00505 [Gammaproteobacteria bacterium]RKZ72230.1 MAG: hypothetical protein DRQ48_00865 [Gammaproteobacteria bacterium]